MDINNEEITSSKEYQEFLKNNSGKGTLNIRVSSASQALPIINLKVIVSKVIGKYDVIFYEGYSDSSGIIPPIILPTPKLNKNDLEVPKGISYSIRATYKPDNINETFKVEMYENISVIQNINISLNNLEEL